MRHWIETLPEVGQHYVSMANQIKWKQLDIDSAVQKLDRLRHELKMLELDAENAVKNEWTEDEIETAKNSML